MPGIVGLITMMPREGAEQQLLTMLGTLCHEPFYIAGSWCNESMGVYVGWVARQGSFAERMPLSNEAGNAVLVFAGEDHPDPRTAGDLKERGHNVGPGSSYLIHVYEDDPTFPASLNGWFHGLVTDCAHKKVILFNDRFGMQRLYYHEAKEAFYFAAEAKAILAVRPELRRTDPRGLGEFVALGCVLENRTLFQQIHVLPPGSAWRFRNGSIDRKDTYFQPQEWEEQAELEPVAYYQELRDVFARNLPRYFNGSQSIGMSLTGGMDTRAVMAWHKPNPGAFPCYTFGGTYRECRDVQVARRVARACGQSHQVIQAGADFLSRFPEYAERTVYLTDGCADVSCSPVLYGCQKAREIAPVRMTGNYGDQILRRFRAFKPAMPAAEIYCPELRSSARSARDTYNGLTNTHPLSFIGFRQAPWHHYSLFALEQTQLTLRSPFLDNDLVRINFRAPTSALENNALRLRLIADGSPELAKIPTDMGVSAAGETLAGSIGQRYQAFTFKAEYAYNHGMPQWLARVDHSLAPFHLERLFLGRHKYYHFRVWYRDALANYVREMLLDSRSLSRGYLERNGLKAMVEHHIKGDGNYTHEIHRALSLELVHRLFIDQQ